MPTRRRSGGTEPPAPATRRPPISIVPASGASRPAIRRSTVVLPQPDGPSSVSISPGRTLEVEPVDGPRTGAVALRPRAAVDPQRPARPRHRPLLAASRTATVPAESDAAAAPPDPRPGRRSPRCRAPDLRGQRLEADRAEDQRHRQLLDRRQEDERGAGHERRPEERQRHADETPHRPVAQGPPGLLDAAAQPGQRARTGPTAWAGTGSRRRRRAGRGSGTGTARATWSRNTRASATTMPGSA